MLNPPLNLVGNVPLDIIRTHPTTYERGRPVAGTSFLVKIRANVQPVTSATDTLLIPEGDRTKAAVKVYTRGEPLLMLREGEDGNAADRFYWEGDLYEVMKVIHYKMGVLNHYKAICVRAELT